MAERNRRASAYSGLISQISVSTDTRSYRPLSLRSCQITCQYRLSPRHGRALIFEPSIRHPSLNPDSEYRIAFDPRSAPRRPPTGQRADRRQHHRGADHRRRIARLEPIEQRCDELRHAHTLTLKPTNTPNPTSTEYLSRAPSVRLTALPIALRSDKNLRTCALIASMGAPSRTPTDMLNRLNRA